MNKIIIVKDTAIIFMFIFYCFYSNVVSILKKLLKIFQNYLFEYQIYKHLIYFLTIITFITFQSLSLPKNKLFIIIVIIIIIV